MCGVGLVGKTGKRDKARLECAVCQNVRVPIDTSGKIGGVGQNAKICEVRFHNTVTKGSGMRRPLRLPIVAVPGSSAQGWLNPMRLTIGKDQHHVRQSKLDFWALIRSMSTLGPL